MVFAFNDKQFKEGMRKLGLEPEDTDKVYKGIGGVFYKRTDSKRLRDLLDRHSEEMDKAIKNDTKKDGFVFFMFSYELANHEYSYTMDTTDTLLALGITKKDLEENKYMASCLRDAMVYQI